MNTYGALRGAGRGQWLYCWICEVYHIREILLLILLGNDYACIYLCCNTLIQKKRLYPGPSITIPPVFGAAHFGI